MQRRILGALAVTLAAVMVGGMASSAMAQGYMPTEAMYQPPMQQAGTSGQFVSANSVDEDLAQMRADIKALQEETAAAKKAAGAMPTAKIGGRIQYDWTMYSQDDASRNQLVGEQGNGAELRRAYLNVKGKVTEVVDYCWQIDVAGGNAATLDTFMTVKELPYASNVRIGHFKEPLSLEQLTSDNYVTFMERPLADVFAPGRNVGVMMFDHSADESMTWAIGAFVSEIGSAPVSVDGGNGGSALTMRYTYLPWYDEPSGGRGLFHTGIAYSYRQIGDNTLRYRQRPEAHLGDRIVDTGDTGAAAGILDAEDVNLLGLEAAYVNGPFSVQSEVMNAFVKRSANDNAHFSGMYFYTSYFLTGESRPYKRSSGTFSRVKPYENFFRVRDENCQVQTGKGAWEIGYRFSHLDLTDAGILGGIANNHTLGLNWYLNPYTRMMWNYVNSTTNRGGTVGNMDIFEMRAQIDF